MLYEDFCNCFFGIGAMFLAIVVFPFIRLFSKRKGDDFGIDARLYVSHTFRNFLGWLSISQVCKRKVDDLEAYKNIHSKIIIANHPSLLDFVYIMSLVPNSTCIVRGNLTKTPLAGVIKQAYITNTTTFEDMCAECKKLTDKGCNVIIFPEGTRSPRHGRNNYKKVLQELLFIVTVGFNLSLLADQINMVLENMTLFGHTIILKLSFTILRCFQKFLLKNTKAFQNL